MKKEYIFISISLLVSLFIYLFFRTERTVVNEIFLALISPAKYDELRSWMSNNFPLNEHVIYSLPEGLWVFCITLSSKHLFIQVGKYKLNCEFIPLVFAIALELFQLLHVTNGRFDVWDIVASVFGWTIARYALKYQPVKQDIFQLVTIRTVICVSSYSIVYLAHVWN